MKFVKVDKVPGENLRKRGEMKIVLDEFMKMNVKSVRVEDYRNKSPKNAYMSFRRAVERWVFPIDVCMRNGEVYLIRRDI